MKFVVNYATTLPVLISGKKKHNALSRNIYLSSNSSWIYRDCKTSISAEHFAICFSLHNGTEMAPYLECAFLNNLLTIQYSIIMYMVSILCIPNCIAQVPIETVVLIWH